jgi:2-oxoglutarate dehydrogenase E1 component
MGYNMENPNQLTLWEAQFGDFVNGAQIIIDQFLAAGESKWQRQCGLVMLLPHGYQGAGPEHSSARIERFLQSTDDDADEPYSIQDPDAQIQMCNWQIVSPSTAANYFHVLRRQLQRKFRKPLIVSEPKGLFRHKLAVSPVEDFLEGTRFHRLLPETFPDEIVSDDKVTTVVMTTGKLYYEMLEKRRETKQDNVALVRIEQLSPFPFDGVAEQMRKYPNAKLVWAQEEPKNMGAWNYVQDRMMTATREINKNEIRPCYVGRPHMASTAEGYGDVHAANQRRIINEALAA